MALLSKFSILLSTSDTTLSHYILLSQTLFMSCLATLQCLPIKTLLTSLKK